MNKETGSTRAAAELAIVITDARAEITTPVFEWDFDFELAKVLVAKGVRLGENDIA